MILGDLSSIIGLNQTAVVETAPVEYSLLLGSIFLFIGIGFMIWIYMVNQKEKKKLKRF